MSYPPDRPPVFLYPSEIKIYKQRGWIIDGRFCGHEIIEIKPLPKCLTSPT